MDKNKVEGIGRQIRGAMKQGPGRLIGDAKLASDGTAERADGEAQYAAGGARNTAREAAAAHEAPPDPK